MQPLVAYPGVKQIVSAEYARGHGITPGLCTITLAPQAELPAETGTLEWRHGGVRMTFPACRLDRAALEFNDRGLLWRIVLADRRWKWGFGAVSGQYNRRDAKSRVIAGTERTPAQLAALCLAAMGERRFDVSDLPSLARPEVTWDHDNPAAALAELCDRLGCRVVLRLNDTVAVRRLGMGQRLPLGPDLVTAADRFDAPDRPDALELVGGPSRFQADLLLEAVGLDRDGAVRPLAELSYKPGGGWEREIPGHFLGLADEAARQLARLSVYRWYRVPDQPLGVDGKPLRLPGFDGRISRREQLLPLDDVQVETTWDEEKQGESPRPAFVWGLFAGPRWDFRVNVPEANGKLPASTHPDAAYPGRFRIDRRRGIVLFADPLFQPVEGSEGVRWRAALLALRVGIPARDADTLSPHRFTRQFVFPGPQRGTGPRIVKHPELVARHWPRRTAGSEEAAGVRTNRDLLLVEADHCLLQAAREYQTSQPAEAVYAGLRAFDLDGAVWQVRWSLGPAGAFTRVCRNSQPSDAALSHVEQRFHEQLRGDRLGDLLRAARQAEERS